MSVLALIPGRDLGAKFANGLMVLAVALLIGWLGWNALFGKGLLTKRQLENARAEAAAAQANARIESGNAQGARDAAQATSRAQDAMDRIEVVVLPQAEARAERIERRANPDAAVEPVDADVLQELADAEREYRAAATRLQGKNAR